MTYEEFKEEIKKKFVQVWKDAGKEVENPNDIFAYVTDDTVRELYNKKVSPEEAYFFCALASIQVKKGK